jgi:quinol monooxygenase YgiN
MLAPSEEAAMAVLVTAHVENQTEEGWDKVFAMLGPAMRQAKGFIAVGGGNSHDGWRTFEIWESAQDATEFFAKYVRPNLPPAVKPHRSIVELRSLLMK